MRPAAMPPSTVTAAPVVIEVSDMQMSLHQPQQGEGFTGVKKEATMEKP